MKTYKATLVEIKKSEIELTEDEIMEHIDHIQYFRDDHTFRLYYTAASYDQPSSNLWGVANVKAPDDIDPLDMTEEEVRAYVRANLPDTLPAPEIVSFIKG